MATQNFADGPADIFSGCDTDTRAPSHASTPRDRMERKTAPKVDRITQRAFASFSMEDIEQGVPDDMASLCWARLDGVWRETGQINLNHEMDDSENWGSEVPELAAMANGNYTTPGYLVIEEAEDPSRTLYLATGLTGSAFVEFRSSDGITLKQVLKRGGPRKVYTAGAPFVYGQRLMIDVTRTGRVRLSLDGREFIRPQPGVSQATMSSQLASDDAFLLGYNLENLVASRRGYDIIEQDPFYLLQNPKYEVFAQVDPKHYFITEKRTVPVGFSLIQENSQGNIYRKTLMTSSEEIQTTQSHTLGGNLNVPVKKAMLNVAVEHTKKTMESMKESESVAQAAGYSRAKQYALVVDHPYITLSDDFIDAVEDARRYHKYQALIDKFGTHYPYAVTYGAAAKMTHSITASEYQRLASEQTIVDARVGVKGRGPGKDSPGGSVHYNGNWETFWGESGSSSQEGSTFVAVGGNGSWDQNGYSAGATPYPILLDLRPISELLNPMNFPGEPEIYDRVRRNLERATAYYLETHAEAAPQMPFQLPDLIPPEPIEVWYVYARQIWCDGGIADIAADLTIQSYSGNDTNKQDLHETSKKGMAVACKPFKKQKRTYSYKRTSPGLLEVRGTRAELARLKFDFTLNWRYKPTLVHRHDKKSYPLKLRKKVGVGKRLKDEIWTVRGGPTRPKFNLRLRFKRIK
jgi:hypothetical protein